MVFAAGSWNWNTSSVSTESIYLSSVKLLLDRERRLSACKLCLPPNRPAHRERRNNNSPPGYKSLSCTRPRSDPVGSKCHTCYVGYWLGQNPGLVPLALSACFGGGLPILMAGDQNAKYVDRNSQPTTTRGTLLRDLWAGFTHHSPL
jgi:hypothetical protein